MNKHAKLHKGRKRGLIVFACGEVVDASFARRNCADERSAMRNGFIRRKSRNSAAKLRSCHKKEKGNFKNEIALCLELETKLSVHFFIGALGATLSTRTLQAVIDRRFRIKGASAILLQYARTLIFFLEAFEHLVNGFIL